MTPCSPASGVAHHSPPCKQLLHTGTTAQLLRDAVFQLLRRGHRGCSKLPPRGCLLPAVVKSVGPHPGCAGQQAMAAMQQGRVCWGGGGGENPCLVEQYLLGVSEQQTRMALCSWLCSLSIVCDHQGETGTNWHSHRTRCLGYIREVSECSMRWQRRLASPCSVSPS